jgi:predicted ATPase/DNA-binding CsgD family transcriptional regulator
MTTATAQPGPQLVGRDREVAVLMDLLAQARAGVPRFAQVTGEPGIGKTYLLAEIGRRADADGWLVLSGRASELERELPFGLVVDAFDTYLASLDARDWERIAPDELNELAGIFPSLRSLVSTPANPDTPAERFRAHRAVIEMIERLAARQPLLLLLDDLQWADGASIEQAGYFLRRPPMAAVMTIGSFRTGQADPALVTAVEAAAREGHVEHMELGPLEKADADQLLNGSGRAGLYEQSGGNPFYLLQLARTDGSGGPAAGPESGPGVPAGVAASIAGELDGLSPTARALADAAAVAGDPFELDLAAQTAGIEDADALVAVDELIASDLARPTTVPRIFQFRHPLVRSAIYESTAPGARIAAHQRAAAALDERGAPAADRAHHVLHAARHGDAGAIAILQEAGTAAAARAPTSAVRWLEAALRLLPASAPSEERLALLMALGRAHATIGQVEEARTNLIEAIELTTDDGPVPRLAVISGCAAVEQLLGRHREAHQRITRALDELADRESAEAASLMIDLAVDAFYRMEYDAMAERASEAVEIAKLHSDPALLAAALAASAFGLACEGPVSEAQSRAAEAAEVVDGLSDEVIAGRLDALTWLSAAEFYLETYEAGIVHSERGLELARATAQGELVPGLGQALANLLFVTGRPADASAVLEEWVDSARLTDNAVNLAWSLLNRSMSAIYEGDFETAVAAGEEALELSRNLDASPVGVWSGAVCGGALLESGDAARALEVLLSRSGDEKGSAVPGGWRAYFLEWLTRSYLELDRPEDAAKAAERSLARAEAFGLAGAVAAAKRAAARVALAAGDPELAAREALAAAEQSASAGARGDAAAARTLAGQALAQAGETDRAVAELERAAAEFEVGQAPRRRELPERELRKLGKGTHRRTRAGTGEGGVESLTGREMEIARLVVDRQTNAEIASELFLSVKTVETHMRNIFRKLDVSSRVDVARAIESADAD